jgi:hypothetical protein
VNTGSIRIAIVAALVVAGVVVLRNGFGGGGAIAQPGGGTSPTTSPTPNPSHSKSPKPTSTPSPQVAGVITAVFNGTTALGLGASMEQTLTKDGYVFPVHAENSPTIPLAKSIVYYRGGADAAQNRSDAQYVADTYLKTGAKVKELATDQASLVDKTVQIAIFIGNDFHA